MSMALPARMDAVATSHGSGEDAAVRHQPRQQRRPICAMLKAAPEEPL
jgi:hypothetical protein